MQKESVFAHKIGFFTHNARSVVVNVTAEPGSNTNAVMVGQDGYAEVTVNYNERAPYQVTFDGRFGLPREYECFTGRAELLDQLTGCSSHDQRAENPKFLISGTGGIGKTQLAVVSAYRQLKLYQETQGKAGCRSVIWFIAGTDDGVDNLGLMTEQFQRLGEQLGFDSKAFKLDDLIKLIYQRLGEKYGPYEVIFDNAQKFQNVKRYHPPPSVKVMITTRNSNDGDWGRSFKTISLGVFTDAEGLDYVNAFLTDKFSCLYHEDDAKELAIALGYFPLALTQALAFITAQKMLIRDYLAEFRQQKALYLHHVLPDDPYQEDKNPSGSDPQKATIWAVIQLSLKKLAHDTSALQILKLCAYLAPEAPIDTKLLSYWTASPGECREAVTALRHYSLLEDVTLPHHVRIHQTVQEILKLDDNEEAQKMFLVRNEQFMAKHFEKQEHPTDNDTRQFILLPHLETVLNHIKTYFNVDPSLEEIKAVLQYYIGVIYYREDNLTEAASYYEEALKFYIDSDNATMYVRLLHNLGLANKNLGQVDAAKEMLEKALYLGDSYKMHDDHQVKILGTLGSLYNDLGDPVKAETFLNQALEIKWRIFGPKHLEYAITLGLLGSVKLSRGNSSEAKRLLEESLLIVEQTYGPSHFEVAQILVNLGAAARRLGNLEEAEVHLRRAISILESPNTTRDRILGTALMNLGIVFRNQQKLDDAKTYLERAHILLKSKYGSSSPKVAESLVNLSNVMYSLGNFEKARIFVQEAIAIFESAYNPRHLQVGMARFTFAQILVKQGQSIDALKQFQYCHQLFLENCGDKSQYTLSAQVAIKDLQRNDFVQPVLASSTTQSPLAISLWVVELLQLLQNSSEIKQSSLLVVARGCFEAELIDQTLELLESILYQNSSVDGLFLRAKCQLWYHQFDDCRNTISHCQVLAESDNARAKVIELLIKVEQRQQLVNRWMENLKTLEFKGVLSSEDQIELVNLLVNLKNFDKALASVDKLISQNPAQNILAPAYYLQAKCYFGLKRYRDALGTCGRIQQSDQFSNVIQVNNKIRFAIEISPKLEELISIIQQKSGLTYSK